jgi:adenine-specific DNA-methyltransferase
MAKRRSSAQPKKIVQAETYQHKEAEGLLRPEVGTQAQFKKKKEPKQYLYDSSLAPELAWDSQNPAREQGEQLIATLSEIGNRIATTVDDGERKKLQRDFATAIDKLKRLSRPFLNWAGKAERLSFEVPTLPLFIHERLSTKGIIETLKTHKRDKQMELDLFGDTEHSIADQILKAYEYQDKWTNRIVLGDSLVVMNSLLHYEGMGGHVQMIYMDPPYGVRFGSNFQPFVRKRDVRHNDDENMTREPEMVKAYRDTWELGLHSYLTYMRDRLLLSRELLSSSGSIFVQISDENLHHIRELMDEVFGAENFAGIISFQKTGGVEGNLLPPTVDYLLWYGKDKSKVKYKQLYVNRTLGDTTLDRYDMLMMPDGKTRRLTRTEIQTGILPEGARRYQLAPLYSEGASSEQKEFYFNGVRYVPRSDTHWKTTIPGLHILAEKNRIEVMGSVLRYRRFVDDFPVVPITDRWESTQTGTQRIYVVQTAPSVIQRCILMTTDPGDLVLDPTCGSGTTAYVAEQWGRRWITIDTSRVPLALARQRLLTATFPYYKLKEEQRGPVGGFVYERKQNSKGEEVGGLVPHITLKRIANNERPAEEVLVDRPVEVSKVTRVTGPFVFEATIPTPMDSLGSEKTEIEEKETYRSFVQRMTEVLRKSPLLHLDRGKTIQFKNVRPPAKSLSLSAEAVVANGNDKPVALIFGPENGAVSEKLVFEAAKEASAKSYNHLYVIGFAIQANARQLVDNCEQVTGIAATYVQATPDLMMGDLLKNMRSSQIFSVCGLPEIKIVKVETKGEPDKYQVKLLGLDIFDPVSMELEHRRGDDVPAWFLDTNYNEMVFHVTQAFFPRTNAWDNLKKILKASYEESVWDHLAGITSAPFLPGDHGQIAVKVIDDRGNELMITKKLSEAE